ncbi:preprotein translocase subunit SECE1 [Rutidosis leptorrhynchoides]|uniref:preprotein translocase subunit SECE1 n=1 Tax=Rutidosis leptorrhynchoides TaxID=125765 RepID=UPI003A9A3BEE
MAFSISHFIPSPLPPSSSSKIKPVSNYQTIQTLKPTSVFMPKTNNKRFSVIVKSTENDQQQQQQKTPSDEELTELGTEIKKAMMENKDIEKDNESETIWGGVVDEIGKIEWPAFNKVVGTTGVVLGVIAGSSVVLLTVNAILAELSDRVFVGRGVQDFFG